MTPLSKTQTTVNVRRTLVRHWIDLDRLTILPVRETVIVSGEFRVNRPDTNREATASLLSILEEELRRCHGVKRVRFDLENWTRDDLGEWVPVNKGRQGDSKGRRKPGTDQPGA